MAETSVAETTQTRRPAPPWSHESSGWFFRGILGQFILAFPADFTPARSIEVRDEVLRKLQAHDALVAALRRALGALDPGCDNCATDEEAEKYHVDTAYCEPFCLTRQIADALELAQAGQP